MKRRTIDYNNHIIRWLEVRAQWRGNRRRRLHIRPQPDHIINYITPAHLLDLPISSISLRFVHTSLNKVRCPINTVRWTPDGRRLITGSTSGEFTLWNGLTFNFETILQAHDQAVRAMEWTHNDTWMLTGDQGGIVKYWQSNMNNLKEIRAHREPVRDLAFCPTDTKFVTASDDSTLKIWSFNDGTEERVLTGHGWDVKCVDWHPYKCLVASGGKDSLIKLWDPKVGKAITTIHGHKGTVQAIEWNKNGHWFVTASRDQLTKVYDIRMMRELQAFRGHKKEVCSARWHPVHESLLVSGGSDGSLLHWQVGEKEAIGGLETAHDSNIWSLDWHPMGHILVSGSNDYATRFWTRERPVEEEAAEGLIIGASSASSKVPSAPSDAHLTSAWEMEDDGKSRGRGS
ncbi:WD40-repeat-containing domain protein [Piptocephalis cylindrospora]|uniref:Polyadenylation factor subunit 2 n=1 Tax=Piptocephalis cylindrospora TaxID=1907219 RepID=A0A4P9Y5N5_9FUNG|nr:WD40-repeat-containing domain protein [Piptocephalis cylindrospora]|eukprot:RKP14263.1 WD40-repeat-containing domain protein [Piptocephalis cylindrospora]